MKYMRARTERKMSEKSERGANFAKRGGKKHNASTMASNKRELAGGADHESCNPHFQLMAELLMP